MLTEVGHANVARTSRVNRCLDGGADVVSVDVTVVEPVTADDHDRIADARPDLAKSVHRRVVGVEQVHDFVTKLRDIAFVVVRRLLLDVDVDGLERWWLGKLVAGEYVTQGVEPQEQSRTTRVNDAGLFQDVELLGRIGQRLARLIARAANHRRETLVVGSGAFGSGARYRKNGPLDGPHHRLAGQDVSVLEGLDEEFGVDVTLLGELLDEASQQLGEYDPGVTTCPHQRAMGDGVGDRAHGGVGLDVIELRDHRFDRERHIRTGIPVGHGIDVQPVDDLFMGAQEFGESADGHAQVGRRQRLGRSHW